MRDLADKVAVVTGAGSGIGRALAERFAAAGMAVVIADVDSGGLAGTEKTLRDRGVQTLAVPTDVADAEAVERLARRTLDAFGAVHLLCNNAGVFGRLAPVWEQTPVDWQRVLGVNLFGVIHGIRAFVPIMDRQGGDAHIVNTASEAGFTSRPYTSVYNASKHAVVTLSESLAYELERTGSQIGVSILCPGSVNTHILDAARHAGDDRPADESAESEAMLQVMRGGVMRGMDPAEVAEHVARAVQEGRFYVFSHPEVKSTIRARIDAALDEQRPVLNAGFLDRARSIDGRDESRPYSGNYDGGALDRARRIL